MELVDGEVEYGAGQRESFLNKTPVTLTLILLFSIYIINALPCKVFAIETPNTSKGNDKLYLEVYPINIPGASLWVNFMFIQDKYGNIIDTKEKLQRKLNYRGKIDTKQKFHFEEQYLNNKKYCFRDDSNHIIKFNVKFNKKETLDSLKSVVPFLTYFGHGDLDNFIVRELKKKEINHYFAFPCTQVTESPFMYRASRDNNNSFIAKSRELVKDFSKVILAKKMKKLKKINGSCRVSTLEATKYLYADFDGDNKQDLAIPWIINIEYSTKEITQTVFPSLVLIFVYDSGKISIVELDDSPRTRIWNVQLLGIADFDNDNLPDLVISCTHHEATSYSIIKGLISKNRFLYKGEPRFY
jgi:hypothetical protein